MKIFIILAFIGHIVAVPIKLWSGPTRATIRNPTCSNDLCRTIDGQGNSVNLPDKNYLYLSHEADYEGRCFYTCSDGQATCQCCNDDSKGVLFYNEKCDRCVYESEKEMTDCPTTPPYIHNDPCTNLVNPNQPNEFCRNLGLIFGSDYTNVDGDFAYKFVKPEDYAARPLTAEEFLALSGIPNVYISCVAGVVGYCRPCASWELLHWVVDRKEDGSPDLTGGKCDWK